MSRPCRRPHAERGSFLIVVVITLLMLSGVAFAMITRLEGETRNLRRQEGVLIALELAEMGLVRSQLELASGVDADGDGLGTVQGAYSGGTYDVEVTQSTAHARRWTLEAVGMHGLSVRRVLAVVEIQGGSYFPRAAFGRTAVNLQGHGVTDSYDSRLGSYASQATVSAAAGGATLGGSDGDVASNGTIDLQGGTSLVNGDATPGPGHSVTLSSGALVTGSTTAASEELVYEPIAETEFATVLATNDNLTLDVSDAAILYDHTLKTMEVKSGAELVLPAGTYFFSSLSLQGGGSIRVTGPVTVYITHAMDLSGGSLVNAGAAAEHFLVYARALPLPVASSKSPLIRSAGNSTSVMAVYAPDMDIEIWAGSALLGAVVGETVTIQASASLHYDVALGDVRFRPASAKRLFWLEPSPPQN